MCWAVTAAHVMLYSRDELPYLVRPAGLIIVVRLQQITRPILDLLRKSFFDRHPV